MPDFHRSVTVVHRISWDWWQRTLLPALEAAREEASLEPLRGMVPKKLLDPERHILTGRRFLLFGPEERKLMNVTTLLRAAVLEASDGHLDTSHDLEDIAELLLSSEEHSDAGLRLSKVLEPEHGIPNWMRSGSGPGVLSAKETQALSETLALCVEARVITDRPELLRSLQALLEFLAGADASCWDHPGD